MQKNEFWRLPQTTQKEIVIEYGKQLCLAQKSLQFIDLERKFDFQRKDLRRLFGSLEKLRMICGLPNNTRGDDMSDDELKEHIKTLAKEVPQNTTCPSYNKPNTTCSSECTCWIKDQSAAQRPKIKYKNKIMRLYRLVYLLFCGPLIDDLCILHACDNKLCFNPQHLWQGTAKQNNNDTIIKNRRNPAKHKKFNAHGLVDPYNTSKLMALVRSRITISERGEWLYPGAPSNDYASISLPIGNGKRKSYYLHRLVLANKLGIKYEDIQITCHRFPANSPFANEAPRKNDLNPDHLHNGTLSQNTIDSIIHNKHIGNKRVLSVDEVVLVRQEAAHVDFCKKNDFDLKMARKLGVSTRVIISLRLGETYNFVPKC